MTIKRMATILVIVTIAAMIDVRLFGAAWATHERVQMITRQYTQEQSFIDLVTTMKCRTGSQSRALASAPSSPAEASSKIRVQTSTTSTTPCERTGPDRIEQSILKLQKKKPTSILVTTTGRNIVSLVHYYHLKLDSLNLAASTIEIKTDGPINPTLRFLRGLSTHREPIVPSSLTLSAQSASTVHLDWTGTYLNL